MGALQCLAGRLLADTYLSAKDLLGKEVSYTLTSLSGTQLGLRRVEVPTEEIPNHYHNAEVSHALGQVHGKRRQTKLEAHV